MNGLVLTLGHGASAIYIADNSIVCGYQLERFTGVKGDSRFPSMVIEHILCTQDVPEGVPIYISHWEPSGDVDKLGEKYWNRAYINQMFPHSKIYCVDAQFTHHDAHAYSAIAYNIEPSRNGHIIVADGFGTMGEVMSIYTWGPDGVRLKKRAFGLNKSLGLLYQFATDYVGLKMNQDEYKLNAMANQLTDPHEQARIDTVALEYAGQLFSQLTSTYGLGADDYVTNLGAFSHAHKGFHDYFATLFRTDQRAELAYFLQAVVREVMYRIIDHYGIKDLTLVGGCFLNVQLNGEIGYSVESLCVMPLCGDEGAGLGVYAFHNPDFAIPDDLCWGQRELDYWVDYPGVVYVQEGKLTDKIIEALKQNKIVNVVRGAMEFGPRAYCNTSTLAMPTVENRKYINHLNSRHSAMPMCPVMTHAQAILFLEPRCQFRRSTPHMIVAIDVSKPSGIEGATYRKNDGVITARPQLVNADHYLWPVLIMTGPLINTSFNNHGYPIVFSVKDATRCHNNMLFNDNEGRVVTFIELNT